MRTLIASVLATSVLSLCASAAVAQGITGAGGTGGAGGGVDARRVVVVREAAPASLCVTRDPATRVTARSDSMSRYGQGQVPPLDPSRKVNEVSCTQPFDFQGKGNLCCI